MPSVGERLQNVRKRRGLSQQQLADRSGVSVSWIRKLEQGNVEDTQLRLETARKLAVALHVRTSALVPDPREDDASQTTVDLWAPVREALLAPPPAALQGEDVELPTVAGVNAALQDALPLFSSDQFSELGVLLPPLLRDADALIASGREGREVRVRLLQLTGWLLTQTRQFEDAATALTRSLDDASDRLEAAATVNTICWLHLRTGNLTEARELATRWADDVEPRVSRATATELSTWGWLLIRVSNASIRDNREGEAEDALRLAHSAAIALGREYAPGNDFLRTFGPITVALKRAENAIITDRPDQTLRLASRIPATGGLRPTSNNWNRHLLDVANAHTRTGDPVKAVAVMADIARTSPQWLPNQRYAKDIMHNVVSRRRTLTPEMREVADIVGISL